MALTISTDLDLATRAEKGAAVNQHVRQITDAIAVENAAITTLTTVRNQYAAAGETANAAAIDALFAQLKTALNNMIAKLPAAL